MPAKHNEAQGLVRGLGKAVCDPFLTNFAIFVEASEMQEETWKGRYRAVSARNSRGTCKVT